MSQDGGRPYRVRLSRAKGWRIPENTVKVDRTTQWGNLFVPGTPAPLGPHAGETVVDRAHAFTLYRDFARDDATLRASARHALAGRNLACWCPFDDPAEDRCHAAVLLDLANDETGAMCMDPTG